VGIAIISKFIQDDILDPTLCFSTIVTVIFLVIRWTASMDRFFVYLLSTCISISYVVHHKLSTKRKHSCSDFSVQIMIQLVETAAAIVHHERITCIQFNPCRTLKLNFGHIFLMPMVM
jgi:hypothetical protein